MATAYLIFGHVGVGKTTYARRLGAEERAVVLEADRWVGRLFGSEEGSFPDFEEVLLRVEPVLHDVWARCLELDVNVVLDFGFWSRTRRDRVRHQVAALGAQCELVEVAADPELAWLRVDERNADPDAPLQISRETFDRLRDQVEPLGSDELHRTVQIV